MNGCGFSPWPIGRVAALLSVAAALVWGATYGQGQPPVQRLAGQMRAGGMAEVQERKQFRGRLPSYYGTVVNERQRERIYAIQRHYYGQIEDLKAQLEAVTQKRDADVADVLTAQQRAEVERLQVQAKARRAVRKKVVNAAMP